MRWVVWLLAGLLFGLVSVSQLFWWLVLPAFVLFIYAISKAASWREVIIGGLLVGTLKCLGGYSFIWAAYPMAWVSLGPISQFIFIFIYWLSTAAAMGLGVVVAAAAAFFVWGNHQKYFLLVFPVIWLLGEILGSFTASVILLGPGSYLNINIGHGYAGLALANISLFYPFASLGGVQGLTFVAAFIGTLTYFVWTHRNWSWLKKVFWSGYGIAALLVLYAVFPTAPVSEMGKKVIAIDTKFSTSLLNSSGGEKIKAREEVGAVLAAAKTAPTIILLPEDARLTDYLGGEEKALAFLDSKINSNTLIVDSMRVDEEDSATLRAVYYDLEDSAVYTTDKQFLTPQGEYISYPFIWALRLFGHDREIDHILQNQNYKPGKITDYQQFPADLPGFMFCFESSSVFGLSRLVDLRESPLVLHAVSHSRFNDPHILHFQLDSMIRAQAIYTKKSVVSANNMANSKFYGPDGRIVKGEVILSTEFFDLIEYNL
ncbi:hypothetical protein A2392_02375 [Candidatus Kaiserbacteria bacterium RIFOXYB1_FULL_46_14]|uniref:Apolipoprotein N-acyltransferase n=1 Tax=Candidatus Kaiserbacteria bacterium RIFOXYB1_FULL_46_14 TaxID=1798531 RepID=A0A1F6FIB7_9BACT|nr:MAG: hypothetical protein A2392_02375 [Candidatus Kaiserbacteria bacterium RIFOXYB1_FULL_46_14]